MEAGAQFVHLPVMPEQTVGALAVKPGGTYVDATAGGGGHSALLLERLGNGRLIAVDRDPDAAEVLKSRFAADSRVTIVNERYLQIESILDSLGIGSVDGILADLGVSSFQLDQAGRGFSYHQDAPLDMRMSKAGTSAADLVNTLSEKELSDLFFAYGEEKFAKGIARAVVRARDAQRIETTAALADIIRNAVPYKARQNGHPARKCFQALRIAVNRELEDLPASLDAMFGRLSPGGRLAVISFHSLEDRIVKTAFISYCTGCTCPPDFPVCVCGKKPRGRLVFKFKQPDEAELAANPRSRSAKLRTVEKIENCK